MTDRHPIRDRARRRAIRALAEREGIPYSVAARRLAATTPPSTPDAWTVVEPSSPPSTPDAWTVVEPSMAGPWAAPFGRWLPRSEGPARRGMTAELGRTIYPPNGDGHRQRLVELRERRSLAERVLETRRAADLPRGRAGHLADRFPPTRGEDGTGVGPLYGGEDRLDVLVRLYAAAAREAPELIPSSGELAWAAELGEETAVDAVCADLDRRVQSQTVRQAARHRLELAGPRQVLDALLVVADDGHAPGTRVTMRREPYRKRPGTIVGVLWGPTGPPAQYEVFPDGGPSTVIADPDELTLR